MERRLRPLNSGFPPCLLLSSRQTVNAVFCHLDKMICLSRQIKALVVKADAFKTIVENYQSSCRIGRVSQAMHLLVFGFRCRDDFKLSTDRDFAVSAMSVNLSIYGMIEPERESLEYLNAQRGREGETYPSTFLPLRCARMPLLPRSTSFDPLDELWMPPNL